jgi:hypothetical protein
MSDLREPPLDDELAEMVAKKASAILRLMDAHDRHQRRDAVKKPHPVFPVEPPPAA